MAVDTGATGFDGLGRDGAVSTTGSAGTSVVGSLWTSILGLIPIFAGAGGGAGAGGAAAAGTAVTRGSECSGSDGTGTADADASHGIMTVCDASGNATKASLGGSGTALSRSE